MEDPKKTSTASEARLALERARKSVVQHPIQGIANFELLTRLTSDHAVTFTRERSHARSIAYRTAGWLLIVVAISLFILHTSIGDAILQSLGANVRFRLGAIQGAVFAAVGMLGTVWIGRGRRLWPVDTRVILESDPRPPVIYLRSFSADEHTSLPVSTFGPVGLPGATDEEIVVRALHSVGPVLAIGDPAEKLASLGAARVYVANDRWHAVVSDLVSVAQLVVLRAGTTPGIAWEVERLVKAVPGDRVIFYVPGRYPAFREHVNPVMPHPLPSQLKHCRFIAFTPAWEPEPVKRKLNVLHLSKTATVRAELAGVLGRLGAARLNPTQ